jgi:hypothetical protein
MADITREDLVPINGKLDDLLVGVAVLEERSTADQARLTLVEGKVSKLEVTWAKAVGLVLGGGGIGGIVSQLIQRIW